MPRGPDGSAIRPKLLRSSRECRSKRFLNHAQRFQDRPDAVWRFLPGVAASNLRSVKQRRQIREEVAHAINPDHQTSPKAPDSDWAEVGVLLDEAMSQLPQVDRDAVLLWFFEAEADSGSYKLERTAHSTLSRGLSFCHLEYPNSLTAPR